MKIQLTDHTNNKLITRENYAHVKDYDGHNYIIHKDDFDLFNKSCEEAYKVDNFTYFNSMFEKNMIGTTPNTWWENNEK